MDVARGLHYLHSHRIIHVSQTSSACGKPRGTGGQGRQPRIPPERLLLCTCRTYARLPSLAAHLLQLDIKSNNGEAAASAVFDCYNALHGSSHPGACCPPHARPQSCWPGMAQPRLATWGWPATCPKPSSPLLGWALSRGAWASGQQGRQGHGRVSSAAWRTKVWLACAQRSLAIPRLPRRSSPEVLTGQPVTTAADIYRCGWWAADPQPETARAHTPCTCFGACSAARNMPPC